ncbi:MAG: hypothetical protein M0R48_06300 [Candidatus Omnitrophica bacterium]|jgi:hypothetical protein|nr:hypothetical protein [Candidatus Omnitrophota bacterium]
MRNLKSICRKKALLFCFLIIPVSSAFAIFVSVETIDDAHIKRIAISPLDENLIYVGSANSLFKSKDHGKNFEKIYVFKDEELTDIVFDSYVPDICYVTASRHVYRIGDRQEMIFSAPEEESVLSIAKYKGEIYMGTTAGLYFISEGILKWQKIGGLSDGVSVYYLEPADNGLYMATNKGVYLLKDKNNLERLFVIREKETAGEEESGIVPNIIKIDIFDKNKLWLGTNKGLFLSKDKGSTWNKFYADGINNIIIYSVAQTSLEKNSLYLGSSKGFFKIDLKKDCARKISEGLYSNEIFWAVFSSEGEIYLATPRGLFKSAYFSPPSNTKNLQEILAKEPSIHEVQQAALRYNETDPSKIRRWRNALKVRALFPTIKLDYDKTITTALGATYDRVQVGPRDWGISFSWDVGDLVWNSYEDDIDTRSRLNTQLRLDILDEINRVYFERLRLKKEVICNNLSEEELCQKDLRLGELTAIIDGYTGGYFSKRLVELAN